MKKQENIDPRDIATWNTTSSSHTGGGGSGENNGSDPGGVGNGGTGSGSGNTVNPPDPIWGVGGFSLDKEDENE